MNLEKNNYFLIVSRLIQHKGIHTLIKAYQQAAQEVRKNKKLVIVGDGSNTNNYVSHLKELAKNNSNIIFAGQRSGTELEVLFKNAYLFIQPSEAEGLSIALLEAMSYGVPVLISDIEENQEALEDKGLEFKNKNVNDLAKQLKFAVNHPNFIKEKAKSAKRHVDKNYSWEDITKHTALLYEQTTEGQKQLILKRAK
ncbi:MAG: glycosyltransferase family 4 protein [Patescibacteria group bacterium]